MCKTLQDMHVSDAPSADAWNSLCRRVCYANRFPYFGSQKFMYQYTVGNYTGIT
jgi:hypothetical protein